MPAFTHGFCKEIDRLDAGRARQLFEWLCPTVESLAACAQHFSASIKTAHNESADSWSLTMFENMVRLNVAQVEVATLWQGSLELLIVQSNEAMTESGAYRFIPGDSPAFYKTVPIPSLKCSVPVTLAKQALSDIRPIHEAYVVAAARSRKTTLFKDSFSPGILSFLEDLSGDELPRPGWWADPVDTSPEYREGRVREGTEIRYERNRAARQQCIEKYGTACVVCDFDFGKTYGPEAEGFIHVHYLNPLSSSDGERSVNPVDDLRPVCPNCHAVLHRKSSPYPFTPEEVRELIHTHARPRTIS